MLISLIYLLLATSPLTECHSVELSATVDSHASEIRGSIKCLDAAPTEIATYPNILTKHRGLNDVNRTWFYDNAFSAAWMSIDGQTYQSAWQKLSALQRNNPIHFVSHIPKRRGTFGRDASTLWLLGGWHPAYGNAVSEQLPPVAIHYTVDLPPRFAGVVGTTPIGMQSSRRQSGVYYGTYLPIVLGRAIEVSQWDGVGIFIAPQIPYHNGTLRELAVASDDVKEKQVAETLRQGRNYAQQHGLPAPPMLIVQAPLREHLVETFDGGLAVSDRAFAVPDADLFLALHQQSIWRGQFNYYARAYNEFADTIASSLQHRLIKEVHGKARYAPDILNQFAVTPEIDALIFAPQIPLADTYYDAVDETPPMRWRLDDFYHRRPRGKLFYEKWIDQVGAKAVDEALDRYLHGEPLTLPSIAAWRGDYPKIDYFIHNVDVVSEQHLNVQIKAVTPEGPVTSDFVDLVTLEIKDAHNETHRFTLHNPTMLQLNLPTPPKSIVLDPDHRLAEWPSVADEDARFNNRQPARWRFLLNELSGVASITGQQITAGADFLVRRIYDLSHYYRLYALYSPNVITTSVTYSYNFGEKLTPLRLAHTVSITGGYERLRREASAQAGNNVFSTLSYNYDSRLSALTAFDGEGLSAKATLAQATTTYGQLGVGALRLFHFATHHALALRLRGDLLLGQVPSQKALRLGGRYLGARGFELSEASGKERLLLSSEYRHVLGSGGRTDLWGWLVITGMEGAIFADAVYLPNRHDGCGNDLFYDVGYGWRFFADILGVSPSIVAVDIAAPFGRCTQQKHLPPITVYLSFSQSFAPF